MNEDELADRLETGGYRPGADGATRQPGDELVELLADAATWVEPEPGGADALLAAIRAERGEDVDLLPGRAANAGPWSAAYGRAGAVHGAARPGAYSGAGAVDGVRRRAAHQSADRAGAVPSAPGRRTRWHRPAAAAAALILVVGAAALLLVPDDGERRPHGEAFNIAGTELAPEASAVATVDPQPAGVAIVLDVRGLPPADPGTYYQAWVEGGAGKVTVGTFHMRGGDGWIYLWSGVEAKRYPLLRVTLEHEGDGEQASDQVVLVGAIDS